MPASEDSTKFTLILGGARSGKSSMAERLAQARAQDDGGVLYVATLLPVDDEMRDRVRSHRASRPTAWTTLEAPYRLAEPALEAARSVKVVLVDCLTVWAGNLMVRESGPSPDPPRVAPGGLYDDIVPLSLERQTRDFSITSELQAEMEAARRTKPAGQNPPDYARLEKEMVDELERLVNGLRELNIGLVLVSNEVGAGLVPPYTLGRAYRDLLGRLNQGLAAQADQALLMVAGLPLDLKRYQADLLF